MLPYDTTPAPAEEDPQALYNLVQAFSGNPAAYLIALLRSPTSTYADIARSIGVDPRSAYQWDTRVPGFRAAKQAIAAHTDSLKLEYAKLAMLESVPDVTDAMVDRAKGTGAAAQRAGERILETAGVLRKDGDLPGDMESIDVVAMRMIRRKP
jgi:hypothetical protein